MAAQVITDATLAESAVKYKSELLMAISFGLDPILAYMTMHRGIQYKEVLPQLKYEPEMMPYRYGDKNVSDKEIVSRTIEVFLGKTWDEFEPMSLAKTIFGGKTIDEKTNVSKALIASLMVKIGERFAEVLWSAKRDDAGKTTATLFNGFDTITQAEITANNISLANKNLFEFDEEITSVNAVDKLKEFYRKCDVKLQTRKTYMFVSLDIYNAYCDAMKLEGAGIVYNTKFEQVYLEGSNDKCQIVPLWNKAGSPFVTLTIKENMCIGVNQTKPSDERIEVKKYDPETYTFYVLSFFGVEFARIDSDIMCIGKLYVAP